MVSRKPGTRAAREEIRQQKERLRFALELSGLGQNEVARKVRASQSVASKWFDMDTDTLPGGRFTGRLVRVLGVNGHWFTTGEGHWHTAPTGGRRDVIHAQGVEAGARMAIARVNRALVQIESDLDQLKREVSSRAADALEDAALDLPADRRHRNG